MMDSCLRNTLLETQAQVLVPVPQRFPRAWRLRGSPALLLANWLRRETGLPLCNLLLVPEKDHNDFAGNQSRQAELSVQDRLKNKIRFVFNPDHQNSSEPQNKTPKKVILIDDFMTTGHTLREASKVLASHGVQEIHIFCLGVKPFKTLYPTTFSLAEGQSQDQTRLLEKLRPEFLSKG